MSCLKQRAWLGRPSAQNNLGHEVPNWCGGALVLFSAKCAALPKPLLRLMSLQTQRSLLSTLQGSKLPGSQSSSTAVCGQRASPLARLCCLSSSFVDWPAVAGVPLSPAEWCRKQQQMPPLIVTPSFHFCNACCEVDCSSESHRGQFLSNALFLCDKGHQFSCPQYLLPEYLHTTNATDVVLPLRLTSLGSVICDSYDSIWS